MFRPLVIAAAVLAVLGGCSKQEGPVAAGPATPAPAQAVAAAPAAVAAPAAAPAPAPAPAAAPKAAAPSQAVDLFGGAGQAVPANHNRGKVLQLQNGGGYSYAEVQMASGKKVWIAGSQINARPGTEVEWGNYSLMRDFASKSLGRTFAEILFVDRWAPVGQAPVAVAPHGTFPNGQPAAAVAQAMSADQMAAAAAGASPAAAGSAAGGTVKSVTNAGGYSYIEVDQGGGKLVWVAAMETPMKAGDKVQWQGGTQMSNFTARSLNRTFDKIVFAQTVTVGK